MNKFNPIENIPQFHYYLVKVVQFADFEVEHIEEILYVSSRKEELIKLCEDNNWDCPDSPKFINTGWNSYHIKYKGE